MKEARHSELAVSEGRSSKGKQPLLNEPLKGCPLYLGSPIFIVNPPRALSAAKCAVIYPPKSQGWKKPQRATKMMTRTPNPKIIFSSNCLEEISFVKSVQHHTSVIQSVKRRSRVSGGVITAERRRAARLLICRGVGIVITA